AACTKCAVRAGSSAAGTLLRVSLNGLVLGASFAGALNAPAQMMVSATIAICLIFLFGRPAGITLPEKSAFTLLPTPWGRVSSILWVFLARGLLFTSENGPCPHGQAWLVSRRGVCCAQICNKKLAKGMAF